MNHYCIRFARHPSDLSSCFHVHLIISGWVFRAKPSHSIQLLHSKFSLTCRATLTSQSKGKSKYMQSLLTRANLYSLFYDSHFVFLQVGLEFYEKFFEFLLKDGSYVVQCKKLRWGTKMRTPWVQICAGYKRSKWGTVPQNGVQMSALVCLDIFI